MVLFTLLEIRFQILQHPQLQQLPLRPLPLLQLPQLPSFQQQLPRTHLQRHFLAFSLQGRLGFRLNFYFRPIFEFSLFSTYINLIFDLLWRTGNPNSIPKDFWAQSNLCFEYFRRPLPLATLVVDESLVKASTPPPLLR